MKIFVVVDCPHEQKVVHMNRENTLLYACIRKENNKKNCVPEMTSVEGSGGGRGLRSPARSKDVPHFNRKRALDSFH